LKVGKIGNTFRNVLIEECSGFIGFMALSVAFLKFDFRYRSRKTESDYLQKFYSKEFTHYLSRCFSFDRNNPDISASCVEALASMFVSSNHIRTDDPVVQGNKEAFFKLEESGIISRKNDLFSFSSPFAKRYMFNVIFPNRSVTKPATVTELVVKSISRMSASTLSRSIPPNTDQFPKEAVFQQLFISGLAAETPPSVCICPELGLRFPNELDPSSPSITGEIDFYVDGDIRWGIELLVGGEKISEHLARCGPGGKYAALDMLDFAIVDFRRGNPDIIPRLMLDEKRITVIFPPDDFSSCTIVIGMVSDQHGIKRAKEILSISLNP
jgi:hypothetical protein